MSQEWLQHIIVVGSDGEPRQPESPSDVLTVAEYKKRIASLLSKLGKSKQDGDKKILIFVHGGLNSYKDSIKHAEYLYPKITDAGCFPVFVSWRLRSGHVIGNTYTASGRAGFIAAMGGSHGSII